MILLAVLGCKGGGEESTPPVDTTPPELGSDVLFFEGSGAVTHESGEFLIDGIGPLETEAARSSAEVVVAEEWPADITPFGLVIWPAPGATGRSIDPDHMQGLRDFLGLGGRVVLAGDQAMEYGGFDVGRGNEKIELILEELGVDIRVTTPLDDATACVPVDHPLAQWVSWYGAQDLQVGPDASWLSCTSLAFQEHSCGEVVVIGDMQPVSSKADLSAELVGSLIRAETPGCE